MTQDSHKVHTHCPVEGVSLEDVFDKSCQVSNQLVAVLRELKEIKQSILELNQAVEERDEK